MAAAGVMGVDVLVKIGAGAGVAILGQRNAKLSFKRDEVDFTVKPASGGAVGKAKKPGWYDWSIACDGLMYAGGTGDFASIMATAVAAGATAPVVSVLVTCSNGMQFAGSAFYSALDGDAPYDKEGTFSATLTGDGNLTPTVGS